MSRVSSLSPLGQWIYSTGIKYPWLVDTSILTHDVEPEAPVDYLTGDRYLDLSFSLVLALIIPLIRWMLRRTIYQPIGQRVLAGIRKKSSKVLKTPEEQAEWIRKWNESSWKFTVFTTFSVLALVVSYGERWFTDSRYWWLGCTNFPPCNLPVSRGVLLFYWIETGFYLQAIHFLAFHEVRRKDWAESMAHHIVTSGLLLYSYSVNFTRTGVVVLLVHDISDIFLELAKLCKYAKREAFSMMWFGTFFVSWIILRVLIFPLFIIRSTLFEPVVLVAAHLGIEPSPHWEIFNGLLLILFALHVYWTFLIFQVLVKRVDVRENEIGQEKDD